MTNDNKDLYYKHRQAAVNIMLRECERFKTALGRLMEDMVYHPGNYSKYMYASPYRAAVKRSALDLKRCVTEQLKILYRGE